MLVCPEMRADVLVLVLPSKHSNIRRSNSWMITLYEAKD